MLNVVNLTCVRDHAVELVITLIQALLLAGLARLLSVINTSSVWILLSFLLTFPVGVGILIVHLLKIEILDDLLHLLDNV